MLPLNESSLDWLIIGGGVHGVHLAARLLGEVAVQPQRLRIVDPGARLLERWRSRTETTGMTHLRSPSVHHLDLGPASLNRFAGPRRHRPTGLFAHPYNRPALPLFNSHCDAVIDAFGLAELQLRDRVVRCSVRDDQVVAQLAQGQQVVTKKLVLALGAGDQPAWPDWAPEGDPKVAHIFEPNFHSWPDSVASTIVVVGGGISAVQVALRLASEGHDVHLLSRHELREHQFDSDPGWLGPRHMTRFEREPDLERRREMISKARCRGSVPSSLRRALRRAVRRDELRWHMAEVSQFARNGNACDLLLSTGEMLGVDRILLATGFSARRPGGRMVDDLIASASLPYAKCGYPVVDAGLRWHPRIHVSGPLAELELGPAARNIAGARRAGDRLVAAAHA